ncbi:MAG TPA: MFS transporter [Pseudolabrys sp.]|jgi:PAT family beta-lactamase induction signal transducer AmpG
MSVSPDASPRPSWFETLAVYFKPRVLIVLLLGFSAGLPFSLAGQTLQAWMTESGVDIRTIGLFAAVGTPYWAKPLWAPAVDALDVPLLSRLLGRRRGWLMLTQILLIISIILLAINDPAASPWLVAGAALLITTASATQDIAIDAFRIESLPENEQAAGMASYVAAYRVAVLVSSAGALFLVSGLMQFGLTQQLAYRGAFIAMSALVLIGIAATLLAREPDKSAAATADHSSHTSESPWKRVSNTAIASFSEFLSRDMAFVVLAFVMLFKFADTLASALTTPFVLETGFTRVELATIIKGVGFAAAIAGGFAGGFVARALSMAASLWVGGVLQALAIFAFAWQAVVGHDIAWLTFAITAENFTSGIGTVIFVAYLSALCGNPLHTATQYALLTALFALARTVLALGSGYIAVSTGWMWYFVICVAASIPSFILLTWLQRGGHFAGLSAKRS